MTRQVKQITFFTHNSPPSKDGIEKAHTPTTGMSAGNRRACGGAYTSCRPPKADLEVNSQAHIRALSKRLIERHRHTRQSGNLGGRQDAIVQTNVVDGAKEVTLEIVVL